jgi:hypothetical protein
LIDTGNLINFTLILAAQIPPGSVPFLHQPMKLLRSVTLLAFLTLSVGAAWAQTLIGGVINTYTDVTATVACANQLVVSSTAGFAVDDTVLVIQMQGVTIDETNTATYGTISSYNNGGKFEKAVIAEISGSVITFYKNLVNSYNIPAGKVQLVNIPQYTNATVTSPLQPADWNGTTGGVLALEVSGTLTLSSFVDANGKGFRGGANTQVCPNSCNFSTNENAYFYATGNYRGGLKGEGVAVPITSKELGRGAQANGGGGGNDHNNGGGGGSLTASGGLGGNNAEPGAFNCKGNNNYGRPGTVLSLAGNRLFLGGGGGAGHGNNGNTGGCPNNGNSGAGGDGGGIVYIAAGTLVGGGQSITSNGVNGGFGNGDGGGGGGAGGLIIMDVTTYSGTLTLTANGGNGGSTSGFGGNRCYGPGGGGAGGAILSDGVLGGGVSTALNGGSAGLVTSSSNACNGTSTTATAGSAGSVTATFTMPMGTTDPASGCITIADVEFMAVKAQQQFSDVLVSWSTARESGNARFEIERSNSLDEEFTQIGTTPGALNSTSVKDYSFTDAHPVQGRAYYRIRQVDTDGSSSYSEIAMVNYTSQLQFIQNVHPNPAGSNTGVTVEFELPREVTAEISLMDATGRLVASHQMEGQAGSNSFNLSLAGVADGLYFVVVSGAGFRDEARVVVFNP